MGILINAAIDTGYGYCLGKSHIKEVIVSNFIKKLSEEDAFILAENIKDLNEDNLIIKFKGTYYAVGRLAIKADPKIRRNATNNRVNDTEHLIELLSTLGLLADSRNFDVNLVVGLPNKLRSEKKKMVEWLKNRFEFSYLTSEGETFKSVIIKQVACVEQPVAAIYNIDTEDRQNSNIISIDLGHSTGDCVYVTEGVTSVNTADWISTEGVKWCYRELEKKLISAYKDKYRIFEVLEKDLQLAIETGVFRIHKKQEDISSMLDEVFEDYANYIFAEIEDKYASYLATTDYVLASGGILSNQAFAKKLANRFKVYDIVTALFDNPQKAIVNGMFTIADALYEDDFSQTEVREEVAADEEPETR